MMKILLFIGFFLFFIFVSILVGVKGHRRESVVWLSIFTTLTFIFFIPNGSNVQQALEAEFLKNVIDECCMLYILKITYTLIFAFFLFNFVRHAYICWKLEKLLSFVFITFLEKVLLICSIAFLVYWVIPIAMQVQSYLVLLHFYCNQYELLTELGSFEEFVIMYTKGDPSSEKTNLGDADILITTSKDGRKLLCVHPERLIANEFGEISSMKKALIKRTFSNITGFGDLGPLCVALKPAEGIIVESKQSLNITEVKK